MESFGASFDGRKLQSVSSCSSKVSEQSRIIVVTRSAADPSRAWYLNPFLCGGGDVIAVDRGAYT